MHLIQHYYWCYYGQHSVILLKMRFLALNAKIEVSQFGKLDGVTVTSGIQFNIPAIKVLI